MKRKIALISEHASPLATLGGVDSGGQNVYVGELAKHLALSGYEVDIFTRWDNPDLPDVIGWTEGVRIIHLQAGPVQMMEKEKLFEHMPEFTRNMLAYIEREKISYALVHANFWMSAMAATDIKKKLQIPFIVTFHALGYIRRLHQGAQDKFPPERIDIEKSIVQQADHIIAECPQDKEDLLQHYAASPDKITIIPCGFNPNEFYPLDRTVARMVLNIDQHECLLLQLGRVVPRKGVDNVIRALSRVRRTSTAVKLMIVGGETDNADDENNPEISRLRQIAIEEGISDHVIFTGRKNRDVLKYYYAAANVFITTPWYEPFGITPLESMACGTPVIGANVGGIKYSVEDGKTGFLVPPNDADALAAKIYELLHDPAMAKAMRANAIRRVNTMFTWAKISEMVSSLYERVILLNPAYRKQEQRSITFIQNAFDNAADTFLRSKETLTIPILKAATMISNGFRKNKKVLVCGNGGSAAESQHLVAELVGRFEKSKRQALPALSLTADSAILTAWANDIGYDDVFARQVEAYGQDGDILICFSTSGQSANVVQAMKMALEKNMYCIALSGKGGGDMSLYAHLSLVIPSGNTQRIQELHLHILHTICSIVEQELFGDKTITTNGHVKYDSSQTINGEKNNSLILNHKK
jgi:D-inositol-3-phosphate glycosyltransferase